jgi:hypothetical protein
MRALVSFVVAAGGRLQDIESIDDVCVVLEGPFFEDAGSVLFSGFLNEARDTGAFFHALFRNFFGFFLVFIRFYPYFILLRLIRSVLGRRGAGLFRNVSQILK